METNLFLSCSAFQLAVTSVRITIAPPDAPSRVSGVTLTCSMQSPAFICTVLSGACGPPSSTPSIAAETSRSVNSSARVSPSRKRLPRKCSARGFISTGSRRMFMHHDPLVHRGDHLVGEAALGGQLGEVLLPLADQPPLLHGPVHHLQEVVRGERLDQEVEGAALGHLHGRLHGGEGRDDDHDHAAAEALADVLGDLEPVDARASSGPPARGRRAPPRACGWPSPRRGRSARRKRAARAPAACPRACPPRRR